MTSDLLEAIDMVIEMMKPADKLMKDIDDIIRCDDRMEVSKYGDDQKVKGYI